MKIENTKTSLVLYANYWKYCFFPLMFCLFGLPLLLTLQVSMVVCSHTEKHQKSCEISFFNPLIISHRKIPISQIKEAVVSPTSALPGEEPSYSISILTTESGEIPFSSFSDSFNHERKKEIVSQINSFLKSPNRENNLKIIDYPDTLMSSIALAWNGFAWFLLFCTGQTVRFSFDKSTGILRIKRETLLGTRVVEHPLQNIQSVSLRKRPDDGDVITYASLKLGSDKSIEVYNSRKEEEPTKIAGLICEFLDIRCIQTWDI